MNQNHLGYFACIEKDGRFVGAVMITDDLGIPQEFKYSEPIKPTKIQAILYGGSLHRHIKLNVIRNKLFKSITHKPAYVFIDNTDPSLMGKCEGLDIIMVQRTGYQDLKKVGEIATPKENEMFLKDHDNRDTLRISTSSDSSVALEAVKDYILGFSENFDIAEPMERIERAITALLTE